MVGTVLAIWHTSQGTEFIIKHQAANLLTDAFQNSFIQPRKTYDQLSLCQQFIPTYQRFTLPLVGPHNIEFTTTKLLH